MANDTRRNTTPRRARHYWLLAGLAAVLLPIGVAGARVLIDRSYLPAEDQAAIELRVRDVGRHPVLLGPYSREGWNHPGPTLFYALALPYRLVAGHPSGLLVGALLLNGAAVAGMAVVAWRFGGPPLFLPTVLAALLVMRSLGPDVLADPWNPYVAVLPFGLFLMLAWAMSGGGAWAVPAAVGVGSFLVQTHVAFAGVTAVLLGCGLVGLTVELKRGRDDPADASARLRALLWPGVAALFILAVLWAPPLFEQVARGGNLADIVKYFSNADDHQSLEAAHRAVALQLDLRPEWLAGERKPMGLITQVPFSAAPLLPPLLVLLLAGTAVAWRFGWHGIRRLGVVIVAAWAAAVISVSRISGPIFPYLVRWTWMVGAAGGIVLAWILVSLVRHRATAAHRWLVVLQGAGVVVLTAVLALDAVDTVGPSRKQGSIVAKLTAQVRRELRPGPGPVLVRGRGNAFATYPWGLMAALERDGLEVGVDRRAKWVFGSHRVLAGRVARMELVVAEGDQILRHAEDPAYRQIARAGDLPAREAARIRARSEELRARHRRGQLSDAELLRAVSRLPKVGIEVVVFARNLR